MITTTSQQTTVALPTELTDGLTIHHLWGGAQIRLQATTADPDIDLGAALAAGDDVALVEETILALAINPDAPRTGEPGDVVELNAEQARAIRDLLNIATARGFL